MSAIRLVGTAWHQRNGAANMARDRERKEARAEKRLRKKEEEVEERR